MLLISNDEKQVPKGYKRIADSQIINQYLEMDKNDDYRISKNEWMLMFIKILGDDIQSLENAGPDSIMKCIKDLSDEFDMFDVNGDKYMSYEEYKNVISKSIFISE